ncbi:MAG TPA: isoprenylcysteine carboxylmethyltransferase family protein [Planctomycetota bacterium]|nr:isoprenylcysteine carboxylmethyltransferase family protein [Planctomycetota bacterium]
MSEDQAAKGKASILGRIGEYALKLLSFFVILEPIWMLLPFAGFLYGSVLHIQTLNQNPHTAWLTHFVFPVLTGGLLGPILVIVGFLLFCIGAAQIYTAKFRKSGLVTGGLYRFVRHPQYISLTFFGLGILLTWGRAMTFIAFFFMMFLYYYLAKSEERICTRLFGEAYGRYRERTSFIVPGDKLLRPLGARMPKLRLPASVRVLLALAVAIIVCFGLMWAIEAIKLAIREVPYLEAQVPLGPADPAAAAAAQQVVAHQAAGVPFVQDGRLVVVRGPYRNAWATGFAETVLKRIRESATLKPFIAFLDQPGGDVLLVFCGPYEKPDEKGTPGMKKGGGPGGRGPTPDPAGPDRVRLILMRCSLATGASVADAFADKAKRTIRQGCVAQVNIARPAGEDFVEGDGKPRGPGFPGEKLWDFFLGQLAAQPAAERATAPAVAIPGKFESATLVLVQAPILRTRLDPQFAEDARDRLAASAKFREHLRRSGAGGQIVAVAFPRPGPNWYREHHGLPQISVFVILARVADGAGPDALFREGGRDLLSAFTVEMDFKIAPPADCASLINPIGGWRDLEERWTFFLSGVGGTQLHLHSH